MQFLSLAAAQPAAQPNSPAKQSSPAAQPAAQPSQPEYRPSEIAKAGTVIFTFHADATNRLEELVEAIHKASLA